MKSQATQPQINAAFAAVLTEYGMVIGDIIGPERRSQDISEARMFVMFLLKCAADAQSKQIAKLMGIHDSSVWFQTRKVIDWLGIYPYLKERYNRLVTLYWEHLDEISDSERLDWILKGSNLTRKEIDNAIKLSWMLK